uniref:Uncharacterized protein n=1 Tax=Arundo donax TaxID=35708 RepID=A0A0A8Z924_ARUDO
MGSSRAHSFFDLVGAKCRAHGVRVS